VMQFATDVTRKKQRKFNNLRPKYLSTNQGVVGRDTPTAQLRDSCAALLWSDLRTERKTRARLSYGPLATATDSTH